MGFELRLWDESTFDSPGPEVIEQALRRLDEDNCAAILLHHDTGLWLQVLSGELFDVQTGCYVLEYRVGDFGSRHCDVGSDIQAVIEAFQGYAVGDDAWTHRLVWS
ncbi:hypothetical protein [Dactylosporangium sp. NPDC050588]|uniref:hypothetical protein n=1 Tax=Dactylosporangium sp. NPDC050588 TaxID=3157211 RepID=UPI0033FDAA08